MQASINSPDTFEHDEQNNNAPSRQVDDAAAAPDESYNSFIPYVLDPQKEDNISIDMLSLYQVNSSSFLIK
jgi:hypothetical protein